jgi:hypothetical protein
MFRRPWQLAFVVALHTTAFAEPFYPDAKQTSRGVETALIQRSSELPDARGLGGPTVPGTRAVLRNGVAYAPSEAPLSVKRAIWAANSLRRKPYRWGGGHGSFYDRGYDCSGTVSFALHHAGKLSTPMPSRGFRTYGSRGRGRWITVYARKGHTFAVIAGLRLDTTGRSGGDEGPRWHRDPRPTRGFTARHPEGL